MDDLERTIASAASRQDRWARVSVVPQYSEAADTPTECVAKWQKIYRLFGASGESQQDEVFAAVCLYFLRNGASPKGKYAKSIRTAGGQEVEAGEVVKVTGKQEGEIRGFLRGRLEDSYLLLKHNSAVAADDQLAAVAANAGIPRRQSWLLADWFGRDCVHFVGDEAEVYNKLRVSKIAMAYAKNSVESAGEDRVAAYTPEVKVQKPEPKFNNDMF